MEMTIRSNSKTVIKLGWKLDFDGFIKRLSELETEHQHYRDVEQEEGNTEHYHWQEGYICALRTASLELMKFVEYKTEKTSEQVNPELLEIFKFLMKLQLRTASLEEHAMRNGYKPCDMIVPDGEKGNRLICPKDSYPMESGSSTDEHDTYLWIKCTNPDCKFSYSPSHD